MDEEDEQYTEVDLNPINVFRQTKKIPPKVAIGLNIAIIVLLLVVSIIMLDLANTIKTEGGTCTANPIPYIEMKMEEQYGSRHKCVCKEIEEGQGFFELVGEVD